MKKVLSLDDLYDKNEEDLYNIFSINIPSWKIFNKAKTLIRTEKEPNNRFYISFDTKKRNTIPLVQPTIGDKRIVDVSKIAKTIYDELKNYKNSTYTYIEEIENLRSTQNL